MTERENIIKGLECCATNRLHREDCEAMDCVYLYLEGHGCIHQLIRDALVLLKAQEPVVHCKDCMYWKSNMLTHFWKPCDVVKTVEDWYCPCGKRR